MGVKYGGRLVHSVSYDGETIIPLLQERNGEAKVFLRHPVILGQAEWNRPGEKRSAWRLREDFKLGHEVGCKSFDIRVRSPDSGMCCVFDSKEHSVKQRGFHRVHALLQEGERVERDTEFDLSKPQYRYSNVQYAEEDNFHGGLPLRETIQGVVIREKCPKEAIFISCEARVKVVPGRRYAITALNILACFSKDYGFVNRFYFSDAARKEGLSLLHFLSEMECEE